jgi:hypothetical protein
MLIFTLFCENRIGEKLSERAQSESEREKKSLLVKFSYLLRYVCVGAQCRTRAINVAGEFGCRLAASSGKAVSTEEGC